MSDKTDREYRQNMLTILNRFYRGRGASLLTKDESEALDYAISSIKTDLKYDLLYEETTHIADADKKIEPTTATKNCESCEYYSSHHKVCNYCYKCSLWTETGSTTKNDLAVEKTDMIDKSNFSQEQYKSDLQSAYDCGYAQAKKDLGVDCISRADAIKAVRNKAKKLKNEDTINGLCGAVAILYNLPSVTPQNQVYPLCEDCRTKMDEVRRAYDNAMKQEPQSFKWCTDCKEYDHEEHCCHRYSKVIRDTVAEIRQEPIDTEK